MAYSAFHRLKCVPSLGVMSSCDSPSGPGLIHPRLYVHSAHRIQMEPLVLLCSASPYSICDSCRTVWARGRKRMISHSTAKLQAPPIIHFGRGWASGTLHPFATRRDGSSRRISVVVDLYLHFVDCPKLLFADIGPDGP
jgi:hypothetical protein